MRSRVFAWSVPVHFFFKRQQTRVVSLQPCTWGFLLMPHVVVCLLLNHLPVVHYRWPHGMSPPPQVRTWDFLHVLLLSGYLPIVCHRQPPSTTLLLSSSHLLDTKVSAYRALTCQYKLNLYQSGQGPNRSNIWALNLDVQDTILLKYFFDKCEIFFSSIQLCK